MKKLIAILLTLVLVLSFAACKKAEEPKTDTPAGNTPPETPAEPAMTWAEYQAAELDSEVTVECYVQGAQGWWEDKITVYAQDKDGAYFLYEMACAEEDAVKLVPGTKIRVNGYKAEWEGEVEIIDATFEIIEGDTWVAPVEDVTALLGTEELLQKQNAKVLFEDMTVKEISFKNDGGDDIYVTVTKNDVEYSFCVEVYLTGPDSEVYKAVSELKAGDVVDIQGFAYWYQGINTHITGVKKNDAMTYADFMAADLDTEVTVECYVQGAQSWWENKITVYAQDADGGYFMYEMACTEADSKKLTPGTKIRVNGYKAEWEGEVEIIDATFEIIENVQYVAEPLDATDLLDKPELAQKQNMLVTFKDMTVKEISFKNDGGDDIYVTVTKDGKDYSFCVEMYLTAPESATYKAVSELQAGDKINVTGFAYWYQGINTHITAVEKI